MKQKKTRKAWELMFRVGEAMRNTQLRSGPRHKLPVLSLSHMRVMGCVVFNDSDQVKIKDIAEELGITSGGVSQLVDALVRQGALERMVCESDRRAVNIRLSPQGLQTKRELDAYFSELSERLLSSVSEEKREIFLEVLETMMDGLKNGKGCGE